MMAPFQVNASVLDRTGNAGVRSLHCLPALHNADTQVGREVIDKYAMSGLEVTDDTFESEASICV